MIFTMSGNVKEKAVSARDISKRFIWRGADVQALSAVSLDVERGEIFALLGPNGAGKSTLLNILMGILTPDSGDVRLLGCDVLAGDVPHGRIGYASGEVRFHWALTPADAIDLYAIAYGLDRRARRRRVAELLDEFDLKDAATRKFDLLSTGEKMRTVLAKSLINKPELLILDEPTIGLDPDGAIGIRREVARLNREQGVTIVLSSHYMNEVEELAGRIAFIQGGRIMDQGPARDVISRAMPGRTEVVVKKMGIEGELERLGFKRAGGGFHRLLRENESIEELAAQLTRLGVKSTEFEIGQPSLEDYFVHMVEKSR
jgi:ABC-type multidrug transport system ATPase subunit